MCLGIPAKVDYLGTRVKTNFALLEDVKPEDWVIVHAGFAISKLNEQEAKETLELIKEYMEFSENKREKR